VSARAAAGGFDNRRMLPVAPDRPSPALRRAQRAWTLLHADSSRSIALAEQALAKAGEDALAQAWARLVLGYNRLNLATPAEALSALEPLRADFERLGDRAGALLLEAGIARAWWRQGRLHEAHHHLLHLRDEGLHRLRHEQRSVLLNAIAGTHSVLGDSEQAFAYMASALRDARPRHAPGFEVVLHCNLANELMQLGDSEAALVQLDEGLERCRRLSNPRVLASLLINRIVVLTDLGRAHEALADVDAVRAIPADEQGRGCNVSCFEILALAALRAGRIALGRELVDAAEAAHHEPIADEMHEIAQARALLAAAEGDVEGGRALMAPLRARLLDDAGDDGLSLRVRSGGLQLLSELDERAGRPDAALAVLRVWQRVQAQRAATASRARTQAALLQTELMRLHRQLGEQQARRRETERARAELQAINEQLSRQVREIERLQVRLREQAARDPLTGLFNRRHLADALPAMLALARREGQPLAVAIIDLDHFKGVNDRHGHAAGDEVLTAFARLLLDESRASDVVCRWGGEEFCLLLPCTGAVAAAHRLERLLLRWRAQVFGPDGPPLADLSFTAGVCDCTDPGADGEALLQAADQALLAGKRAGRAQVRCVQD
jgi:diguanylate cyclase (GGDEF)-like protein